MSSSSLRYPPLWNRIGSVWFRHVRVYSQNLVSNALPPFLEPLIFLVGIGLGLGQFIGRMDGVPYIEFLASGLLVTTAMFTAAFECSFGTYIRLEFDKVYDGMLAAPITVANLLIGEILWAATKGLVFSFTVLIISAAFGILSPATAALTPLVGFLTGAMFGAFGLVATSIVKNISQFNFLFSGFLSPMFFFSGVVFPISRLPSVVRPLAELLPLTHPVRLARAIALDRFDPIVLWDLAYIVAAIIGLTALAIVRLRRRLVD